MFHDNQITVLDSDEESRVRDLLLTVLKHERDTFSLLKRREWWAIPVASADHFEDRAKEHIVEAIQSQGDKYFYAVAMERLDGLPQAYRFISSLEGIGSFNDECALYNFVIFSPRLSWLIICTKDDYYAIVGDTSFSERSLGGDIQSAYVHFEEFIEEMSVLQNAHDLLVHIFERLKVHYQEAKEGDWIDF